jgi:hypothetical protein
MESDFLFGYEMQAVKMLKGIAARLFKQPRPAPSRQILQLAG